MRKIKNIHVYIISHCNHISNRLLHEKQSSKLRKELLLTIYKINESKSELNHF